MGATVPAGKVEVKGLRGETDNFDVRFFLFFFQSADGLLLSAEKQKREHHLLNRFFTHAQEGNLRHGEEKCILSLGIRSNPNFSLQL